MKGVSQVEFLVVLMLFFIAIAIGWPYLMRSDNSTAEGKAVNVLKEIHTAQADYYGGRRMYGTEAQLKSFGVLNIETHAAQAPVTTLSGPPLTYSVDISIGGGGTKYCAAATPSSNKGRTVAIDETGAIMYGKTCYDGSVQ
jgi:type II secretory pathway pseudopilin PulG